MRTATLLAALLALASTGVGAGPINSQSFLFVAPCTGKEMVYDWKITSGPKEPSWHIEPWADERVEIVGAEIADFSPWDLHTFWMIGNDTWGDAMLFAGATEERSSVFYPDGEFFWFTGRKDATPLSYIDLHGRCFIFSAHVMVTLYYRSLSKDGG